MLGVLAVTSTDGWQKRLGRRWKRLHRLVFVLLPLALWHYFLQSKSDVTDAVFVTGLACWLVLWRLAPKRWRGRLALLPPLALVPGWRPPASRRPGTAWPPARGLAGAGGQSRRQLRPAPGGVGGAVRAGGVRGGPVAPDAGAAGAAAPGGRGDAPGRGRLALAGQPGRAEPRATRRPLPLRADCRAIGGCRGHRLCRMQDRGHVRICQPRPRPPCRCSSSASSA